MKKIFFFLPILLVILLLLVSNLFIGTGNYSTLKSILSNETKYYIKRYIFPWKLIAQHENEIDFLKDKVSVFDNEKLSKYDIAYKKSLKDIKIIKKKDKKLSHNLKLQKYKLKDGFNSGIYREYPGSGFLDFHGENFFILSARGILGFHDNIKNHLCEKISLGVGVDLAVSPDSRGEGIFRKTVEKSYEAGINGNLRGILGVANSQSSPRMTGAMGWKKLPSIDLRLLKPSKSLETSTTFQIDSDQFRENAEKGVFDFEKLTPSFGYMPVWNLELLTWRLSRPGSQYFLHLSPSALLISTTAFFRGFKTALILKALPLKPCDERLSISPFISNVAKHHRTPFIIYWGENQYFEMKGIKIPRKIQPSPLELVLHFFEKKHDFQLTGFELLDFDAF